MILMEGTWGYSVALTTNLNLTDASAIRVRLVPPNGGAPIDKQLTQADVTTPAIGLLQAPIDEGDLVAAGTWHIQAYDETPGREIASSEGTFKVEATI